MPYALLQWIHGVHFTISSKGIWLLPSLTSSKCPPQKGKKIQLCAQNTDNILGAIVNALGRAYMITQKRKYIPLSPPITFAYQNVKFWSDDLRDKQLPNGWEKSYGQN